MMKGISGRGRELIKYILTGGITTIIGWGVYYVVTEYLLDVNHPLELQLANVLSWCVGILFSFFANKRFVFLDPSPQIVKQLLGFFSVRIGAMLLENLELFILVSLCGFNDRFIKILVSFITVGVNYLTSKLVIFKKK